MPDNNPRIVVIGAGAIGGAVGGYLTKAGHNVTLVDKVTDHVNEMNRTGLRIEGIRGDIVVPVNARTPDQLEGQIDLLILATKSQHTSDAIGLGSRLLADHGLVIPLQNGLYNVDLVKRAVGSQRTLGAMIRFGCGYRAPGHIQHLTEGFVKIGELDGKRTDRVEAVAEILASAVTTDVTPNVIGWLWTKETYGCLLEMTALVDATITEVLELPGAGDLGRQVMAECVKVAQADGIHLEQFDFLDPLALVDPSPDAQARTARDIAAIKSKFGHTKCGVWRDIVVRKIPTEIQYTGGSVVRKGEAIGCPTPLISRIVQMIGEIESGTRTMDPKNLAELRLVVNGDR